MWCVSSKGSEFSVNQLGVVLRLVPLLNSWKITYFSKVIRPIYGPFKPHIDVDYLIYMK